MGALLFAVISFIIAQLIVVTLHYRAARLTHETEEIKLARELYREFYLQEKSYLQIAGAIESCQKLYKNDGGSFSHVAIKEYLGFFSHLGLFMQRGALSEELIATFSAHISSRPTNILKSKAISSARGKTSSSRKRSPNSRRWPSRSSAIRASPPLLPSPKPCVPTYKKELHRHDTPHCDRALPDFCP